MTGPKIKKKRAARMPKSPVAKKPAPKSPARPPQEASLGSIGKQLGIPALKVGEVRFLARRLIEEARKTPSASAPGSPDSSDDEIEVVPTSPDDDDDAFVLDEPAQPAAKRAKRVSPRTKAAATRAERAKKRAAAEAAAAAVHLSVWKPQTDPERQFIKSLSTGLRYLVRVLSSLEKDDDQAE